MMSPPVPVAGPAPVECKVCQTPSPLFGVVDFHKSCIEAQGRRLPLSGVPVYFRQCPQCGLVFSDAFDTWTHEDFHRHIYNGDYIVVDPDYVEVRPANYATLVADTFAAQRSGIQILDYGGGSGLMAERLRGRGFAAATYDPFSSFDQMPTERFDIITCIEVMEHVPFPRQTVATMVSLLKQPGVILFSTLLQPADFATTGLAWWYAGPRNGHVSLYTAAALAQLFHPHGMRVASFTPGLHLAYAELPAFAAHLKVPH